MGAPPASNEAGRLVREAGAAPPWPTPTLTAHPHPCPAPTPQTSRQVIREAGARPAALAALGRDQFGNYVVQVGGACWLAVAVFV